MNAVIYLQHNVSGFSIEQEQITLLNTTFKNWSFVNIKKDDELFESLKRCDLFITWRFKKEWYKAAPCLRAIFTPSAGQDWIERDNDFNIPVFFGSFHGPLMAESLLAMMLFFNRKFLSLVQNQKNHIWDRNILSDTHRLGSQTVTLIGYGNIARECARVLKVFGCKIIGIKHSPQNLWLDRDADDIIHPDNICNSLGRSDHIISILPGIKENDCFFTTDIFKNFKKGAYFYNIGRGNCYDENDLLWALDNNILAGAGLDVFFEEPLPVNSSLWEHPKIFIMPHGAAICKDYIPLYIQELIGKLKSYL